MEMVPSSAVLPTLMIECGKSLKVSPALALSDSCLNGSCVTCCALLTPPLATPTLFVDGLSIGCPSAPESYFNIAATLVCTNSRT